MPSRGRRAYAEEYRQLDHGREGVPGRDQPRLSFPPDYSSEPSRAQAVRLAHLQRPAVRPAALVQQAELDGPAPADSAELHRLEWRLLSSSGSSTSGALATSLCPAGNLYKNENKKYCIRKGFY